MRSEDSLSRAPEFAYTYDILLLLQAGEVSPFDTRVLLAPLRINKINSEMIQCYVIQLFILVGLLFQPFSIAAFNIIVTPSVLSGFSRSSYYHHRRRTAQGLAASAVRRFPKSSVAVRRSISVSRVFSAKQQDDASVEEKSHTGWRQPQDVIGKAFAVSLLSVFLWSSPTITTTLSHDGHLSRTYELSNNIVSAKEMASGSGSRVNKDPESLLRYGLPIDNQEVGALIRELS